MAATKDQTPPAPADIDEGFSTASVTHRGRTFTFRELSAEEYDHAVDLATKGAGDEKELDTVQLLRWMIVTGSVEPKLDAAKLGKLPFSTVTRISKTVNDLHFAPDEDEAEQPDEPELDEDGNEKRPNS